MHEKERLEFSDYIYYKSFLCNMKFSITSYIIPKLSPLMNRQLRQNFELICYDNKLICK